MTGHDPHLAEPERTDLLCLSHLRWDFVFQRPQHLLTRAARTMRVFFFEEPLWLEHTEVRLDIREEAGVTICQPRLPWHFDWSLIETTVQAMLDGMIERYAISRPVLWFYTPQALRYAGHLEGYPTVYDCMDELSAFKGADTDLPELERTLLDRAGLVFTGGTSLYEAKRQRHPSVHEFPSGVDTAHFLPARTGLEPPPDQAAIPSPRAGYYGVIDERLDLALIDRVAALRPGIQFVMLGPVVKIDPASLPRRPNLHWLGSQSYSALPAYVAGWDVALMPFALNEATRYISPTKTPEYLAAGRPVVSTPIADVVRQYGGFEGVRIAGDATTFASAIDGLMQGGTAWHDQADVALAHMSWDATWSRMAALITARRPPAPLPAPMPMRRARYDVVVVGAGFAGSVLAERLAAASGQRVLLVDRRNHIGGNAHDRLDQAGVLIHPYGPHIFHTNSDAVLDYLSRFTRWRRYEHRVLAHVRGELLPIPINRTTVNRFFHKNLAETEIAAFLATKAEPATTIRTSADIVLGTVGRELYEAFFRGYTRKQWGLDPSELDKAVTARVPTRTNDDDRYFTDKHQVMPLHGYTSMFQSMLDHPGIDIATETEWQSLGENRSDHLVFTGPVDEFFGHRHGKLPYRSLAFRHETHRTERLQQVAVVNYPDEAVPHTRVTEFKHLTGQEHPCTSLCYEYPAAEGDPYYPVPRPENAALYARYQALADAAENVTFAGRLATYRYYNMDQVVGQALATYAKLKGRKLPVAAE